MFMQPYDVIYQYQPSQRISKKVAPLKGVIALGLIALSLGGIIGPFTPELRLEASYFMSRFRREAAVAVNPPKPLPKSVPVIFNPLITEDGASIDPINKDFSLVVPKVGINASIIPAVNPADPGKYTEALKRGVAHASTSYFPDEDGTVYLFSHSTNYDWFVKDLNAVFYLLKNLSEGDLMVVFYKGKQYTYRLREKRVVKPTAISYLIPQKGTKTLILQTCWPPGSTAERLLLFADLVEEQGQSI